MARPVAIVLLTATDFRGPPGSRRGPSEEARQNAPRSSQPSASGLLGRSRARMGRRLKVVEAAMSLGSVAFRLPRNISMRLRE